MSCIECTQYIKQWRSPSICSRAARAETGFSDMCCGSCQHNQMFCFLQDLRSSWCHFVGWGYTGAQTTKT
uniref:Uncharacterized protein n=1 Tax=Anguilla anguilla TaxID=7936 RepID=A0A0E9Q1F9_ANGAN